MSDTPEKSGSSSALKLTVASGIGIGLVPLLTAVGSLLAGHGLLTREFLPLLIAGVVMAGINVAVYVVCNAWLKRAEVTNRGTETELRAERLAAELDAANRSGRGWQVRAERAEQQIANALAAQPKGMKP